MAKECEFGPLRTGVRFQNIVESVTQIFHPAKKVLKSGCAESEANDHCDRHKRGHCVVGPRRGPELGRAKRFGCSFQSWHTSCLCSRVRRTDRSPRAQRKFVGSFFDETGIGIDWELSEQICRSAGRAFQAYAERRRKQSDRGSVVSLQTSPLARTHSQTDSVFSPSMSAYIAQPSLVSL